MIDENRSFFLSLLFSSFHGTGSGYKGHTYNIHLFELIDHGISNVDGGLLWYSDIPLSLHFSALLTICLFFLACIFHLDRCVYLRLSLEDVSETCTLEELS